MGKMTEKQLVARDAKRDLAAELLQAVREMKAGKAARVRKVSTSRKRRNPHIGESFDTFLKEEGIYQSVQTTAKKRALAATSSDIKQQPSARRRRSMKRS